MVVLDMAPELKKSRRPGRPTALPILQPHPSWGTGPVSGSFSGVPASGGHLTMNPMSDHKSPVAMELQYQLKEGAYNLYDLSTPPSKITGEHRLRLRTDTVAIAFDARTGELHEHGSPARIHSWALNTRRRLRSSGNLNGANDIVVVSGPLPVEEINKCLTIEGYCRRMFTRLSKLPHGKGIAH